MSAILFLLDAYRQRSSSVRQTALVAGIPALVAVLVGGVSLGLMICYAIVIRLRPHDFDTAIFALVGMVIGLAVSFLGWQFYALYLSYRSGVDRLRALKTDSWAWPTLALFPFLIVQPWWLISSGRALGITIAAFLVAKLIGGARLTQTVRDVLIIFVVTRISIVVIAELASAMIGQRAGEHITESDNPLLAVWGRWDAVHYLDIARRGYYGTDMAFFPLFPLLINLLARLAGSSLAAGLIISNAAAFFALLFFYKLVEHQYNRAIAHRAIFYVSIF
ncbi:MAG TPA: mannosyltransferase family protein, partial [Candidatus Baltobacteraceae bacterium]|nr:mannosyltransferase family protein [Candidatus Baltobacteraceae bacterium]